MSKATEIKEHPHKKFKSSKNSKLVVSINSLYDNEKTLGECKNHFNVEGVSTKLDCGIEIIKEPFTCYVLPNFIEDDEFLENLKDSLNLLDFDEKNNDLYKFHQSNDLKVSKNPFITALRELLYGSFLKWLQNVTGFDLNNTIDMSCAKYESTDILLCHDDQLESRKIAYIYYLVPPNWSKEDGGTLDLFDSKNDQPNEIVRSLTPAWNNFVFFEVSPHSFHQVSEILSDEKCRLSVSGWFHSPVNRTEILPLTDENIFQLHDPDFVEEDLVYSWINPTYLKEEIQMEIQQRFEEESEIQLVDFLNQNKFIELSECLKSYNLKWARKGPVNQRNIFELDLVQESLPEILKECLELLKSEAMFLILSNLTGLGLHALMQAEKDKEVTVKNNKGGKCRMSVHKWNPGSYTLLSDQQCDKEVAGLDAKLFFNAGDWKYEYGGFTSYVAKGEDEELLSVSPVDNTLALVYRDKETMTFVKHINHLALQRGPHPFHDIHFIYYE